MTNYYAIATVTAVLQNLLAQELRDITIRNLSITSKPPDIVETEGESPRLNLFLYHVSQNPGFNIIDKPTRNSSGELIKRPVLALNLYYLLTAYAARSEDELLEIGPQKVLTRAMTAFNENPVLDRNDIQRIRSSNTDLSDLDTVDYLDEQIESVKLSFHPASFEEMTKIWSSFFQTHYRLSVAYSVSVVLLDNKKKKVKKPALPVQVRKVHALPFQRPMIERIEPQFIEMASPPADTKINLIGRNLGAAKVLVQFGDTKPVPIQGAATPSASGSLTIDSTSGSQILTVNVPTNLAPGINQVHIIHPIQLDGDEDVPAGSPPTEHLDWEVSNIAAFVLAPKILDPASEVTRARGQTLTVKVSPPVTQNQKVSILLNDREFEIKLPQSDPPQRIESLPSITIPMDLPVTNPPGVPTYIIRVRVDGADSMVHVDKATGKYVPSLVVT
jgi:Pvc16 N-terminal domain